MKGLLCAGLMLFAGWALPVLSQSLEEPGEVSSMEPVSATVSLFEDVAAAPDAAEDVYDIEPAAGDTGVGAAPTEAEARAAFDAARASYRPGGAGERRLLAKQAGDEDVTISSGGEGAGVTARAESTLRLEDIRLVIDVENKTLREVIAQVVRQAATYTGPWTVKWRLKEENRDLMEERVNLTVEAKFGEFCTLLAERIKNMSGTQLYITAFNGARVILITDTYY